MVVENFFPPSPSDVFILLAAFLTRHGTMEPLTIFLVAWGFGSAGAAGVYWGARRFGRRFLEGRLGRRLMSPGTFAAAEREYLRFGLAGMFLFRLLPAFRAVVAPFAGFVNLPPWRALPPLVLACGVWYATLTGVGSLVGSEWQSIERIIARINQGLGVVAVVVALAILIWVVRRRRAARAAAMATLAPFEPLDPAQPAPMVGGLPVIDPDDLEAARIARREARREEER